MNTRDDIYTYETAIAEAVEESGVSNYLTSLDSISSSFIDAIIEEV